MRLDARGPRAAGEVWEDYARPARWPAWSPQITGVDASAGRIAAGVTGTVHGPLGLRVRFAVLAVDEDARTWTWRVTAGPVRAELEHGVVAVPGGTSTWLLLRAPAVLALAYSPAALLALRRLVGA
ncbi:SRPBCC family protein [Kineococcus terrestris]|uniref:SRPBCC family protein n=1 Tax=Kineococcus terrestris TaxID=2044856 RepID=UPI0034DAC6AF